MSVIKDMKVSIKRIPQSRISQVDFNNLPFGRVFADHMLVCDYKNGAWGAPEIMPYGKFEIFPCITALHYGQAIFEGMKAFKNQDGDAWLFRPEENFKRMNLSAWRMCMPEITHEIFIDGLKELVRLDSNWIPTQEGASLYVRPHMFGTDEYVGIKPSDNYRFVIFSCPVGAYYPEPVGLWATRKYVRANEGGTGEAKAAGNYAASLLGAREARDRGLNNVMWLDGHDHAYIEECGTMNMFFVINGTVVTPNLSGTILHGITRDSVLTLLEDHGIPVEVRRVSMAEIKEAFANGTLEEAFGAGTAATIAHVDRIGFEDEPHMILPKIEDRKISNMLLRELADIRTGRIEDKHNWMVKI
ncbi:MAG: branched-chain amino acid aminotransferase [Bacteroidia bacterium]|nr:branched-chain amino acid aminotransferase [Bacteroidia bacterium]